jgi:pilus assembly protein CpaF
VIQQDYCADGHRRLTRISEVVGVERDQIVLADIFRYDEKGFYPTGHVPGFLAKLRARGIAVDEAIFA